MILKSKICGVSDPETLKYIVNHKHSPEFVGFIVNYPKSNRYVNKKKLKELLKINLLAIIVNKIKLLTIIVNVRPIFNSFSALT